MQQQAAEKAVKAVLVASGIDFPRTHVLERLDDLLGEAEVFDRSALADLTPWAVAGRYPEDIPDPSYDEAHRMVEHARFALQAAQGRLRR